MRTDCGGSVSELFEFVGEFTGLSFEYPALRFGSTASFVLLVH